MRPRPATSRSSLESAPLEVLVAEASTLNLRGLQGLIDALRGRGYRVMGPTVRNGAIIIDEVLSIDDLPRGVGDEQDAGHYRLTRRDDDALFGFAAPMQSAKPVFFPADELLWHGRRNADEGFSVEAAPTTQPPVALLGVRSCDLAAVGIHDVVLTSRALIDPGMRPAARGPSWWPPHVPTLPEPVSARRWVPVRSPRQATTSP